MRGWHALMHCGNAYTGEKLVMKTPILCDDLFVLCCGFIIQDLKVHCMAQGLEADSNRVVRLWAIFVRFCFEGCLQDCVTVTMKDNHNIKVSTARSDRKASCVIRVKL